MTRRAIVHIGTEKTGSTTLQCFLAANREALLRRGRQYPSFCGAANHTGLAALAMDGAKQDPILDAWGGRGDLVARMHRAAEADLHPDRTAILSSEHCHSRLTSPEEVARLKRFLDAHFDAIDVCVYLRRQDRLAASLYSTELKSGRSTPGILPAAEPGGYFDYDVFLRRWEAVFGADRVHVRIFERGRLAGGSVVPDFLSWWGIDAAQDFAPARDFNVSIAAPAQEFLRLLNGHLCEAAGPDARAARAALVGRLEAAYAGPGALPSRAAAMEFVDRFASGNEAVRSRHFADLPSLFDEDFSAYPDALAATAVSVDDMAAIAARVHHAGQQEIRRLESEIRVRDARLLWARNERSAAIETLEATALLASSNPSVFRTLGECLFQQRRLPEAAAAAATAVRLLPESAEYRHFLGIVLRAEGDAAGALRAQEAALALKPDHAGAARELATLRARHDAA
jgi:hypothetical protein